MENMEYYKILDEALKLDIDSKLSLIVDLMNTVVSGVEKAINEEQNLMIAPSVNNKTLDLLEIYSGMLGKFKKRDTEIKFQTEVISYLMFWSKRLTIEEKIMLIYHIIDSIKLDVLGEFSRKFKLEDFDKARVIEINKSILEIARNCMYEYTKSIKSARVLENRINGEIDKIVSSDNLLR